MNTPERSHRTPTFARWIHPGLDWVVEFHDRADGPRLEQALTTSEMGYGARLEVAFALAARVVQDGHWPIESVARRRVLAHADALVELEPHALEPWRLQAGFRFLEGDTDDGVKALEWCTRLEPQHSALLQLEGARVLLEQGLLDEAADLLGRASSDDPPEPEHILVAAVFDREAGYPSLAIERLDEACTNFRDNADLRFERARTLWVTGAHSDAVEDLEWLRRARPACVASQRNLLKALTRTKRGREVHSMWRYARPILRADPELTELVLERKDEVPNSSTSNLPLHTGESVLEGRIGKLSLPDVLNLLGHSKTTGRLVLRGTRGRGEIRMKEGRLVDVRAPGETPLPPSNSPEELMLTQLEGLLEWTDGEFVLEPGDGPMTSGVALDTPVALLHACANLDERRRGPVE